MNTYANKKGDPAAAEECRAAGGRSPTGSSARIQACHDFANKATKTEMLKDLLESQRRCWRAASRATAATCKPEDDPEGPRRRRAIG